MIINKSDATYDCSQTRRGITAARTDNGLGRFLDSEPNWETELGKVGDYYLVLKNL